MSKLQYPICRGCSFEGKCGTYCLKAVADYKCRFDEGEKGCFALACYSNDKCGARDENGNPRYTDLNRRHW